MVHNIQYHVFEYRKMPQVWITVLFWQFIRNFFKINQIGELLGKHVFLFAFVRVFVSEKLTLASQRRIACGDIF